MMALGYGIAEILADIYAPDRIRRLAMKAKETLAEAREQDVENVAFYIWPQVSGYWSV